MIDNKIHIPYVGNSIPQKKICTMSLKSKSKSKPVIIPEVTKLNIPIAQTKKNKKKIKLLKNISHQKHVFGVIVGIVALTSILVSSGV